MKIVYTESTPDNRNRMYARIVTTEKSDQLSNTRFGTISEEKINQEPVQEGKYEEGKIQLDDIENFYAKEIKEDFQERSLEGFVEELTERTPYTREEAEIIVTYGWFNFPTDEALHAINQHLREPYDELSEAMFNERIDTVTETRQNIENAKKYPFSI